MEHGTARMNSALDITLETMEPCDLQPIQQLPHPCLLVMCTMHCIYSSCTPYAVFPAPLCRPLAVLARRCAPAMRPMGRAQPAAALQSATLSQRPHSPSHSSHLGSPGSPSPPEEPFRAQILQNSTACFALAAADFLRVHSPPAQVAFNRASQSPLHIYYLLGCSC